MDNRIFLIEEYFYPDGWGGAQITRDIALKLQNSGWNITAFCGSKPYIKIQNNLDKDPRIEGVLNHETRKYIEDDIKRYIFSSLYAQKYNRSPKITDFPIFLSSILLIIISSEVS